mgnify:CR=1 FL=1
MKQFDIFNPPVSQVAKGLEGKVITLMGNNSTGKTEQATNFPKPLHLSFEKGLNAIPGVPYFPLNSWSDFQTIIRQLTLPSNIEKIKEQYKTIIFDEVYTAANYCQESICKAHGVATIGEGKGGFGYWKEYEVAFWKEVDKLLGLGAATGITLVFIIHTEKNQEGQFVPKGDKRSVDPIIDNSDIVAFLKSNGVDEKGQPLKSSAFFVETPQWFARTRFKHMVPALKEFTAENLRKAIEDAVQKTAEESGTGAVTFEEKNVAVEEKQVKISREEALEKIKNLGMALAKAGHANQANDIVKEVLGTKEMADGSIETIKPNEVHENETDKLHVLALDLENYAEANGVEVE